MPEKKKLAGRVALVAGASKRKGFGAAVELAADGAVVYALARSLGDPNGPAEGTLRETVAIAESLGGTIIPVACDCTNSAEVGRVVDRIRAEQGRLDVVVNNVFNSTDFASTIGVRFWEAPDLWDRLIGFSLSAIYIVNAKAALLLIETAKRTGDTTLIVNVSGRGALNHRYNVAYGAGKSATERFTRDMAIELREHNVSVVSIWPNGIQKEPMETHRYSGRAVTGLLADRNLFDKTGKYFWCAELGAEYGFTDEFGHPHPVGDMVDSFSLDRA